MKLLSAFKVLGALLVGLAGTSAQAVPNAYIVNVLPACTPPATCTPVTTTATVTVFDTANNTTVATVPIPATVNGPATMGPQEIVLNRTLTRAYIANFLDDRVEVLDISNNNNTFLAPISLPGSGSPIDLAFRPSTDLLYVVRQNGDVVVVDTAAGATGAVVGSPVSTGGSGTQAIAFNGSGSRAYVANMNSDTVAAIAADAAPPALVSGANGLIATGDQPTDVEYDTVANRLFVTNAGSSSNNVSIFSIAPSTDAATPAGSVAFPTAPLGIRLTPDRTRVFVSLPFGNAITSFANTPPFGPAAAATPTGGIRPQYFNFRLADSRLYVPNSGSIGDTANDSLSVFDIAGATATPVGASPFPVSNNPKYVVIADGSSTLQFDPTTASVTEAPGATVTLTVTRGGDTSAAASATATPMDGAGANGAVGSSDFTAGAVPVSFAPGVSSTTISVLITNDSTPEQPQTFTVVLTGASGATLGTDITATVTITDDDSGAAPPPPPPPGPAPSDGGGGGGCTLGAGNAADYGLALLLLLAGTFYALRRRIGR